MHQPSRIMGAMAEQTSSAILVLASLAFAACRTQAPVQAPAYQDPPNACIPVTPGLSTPAWSMVGGDPSGQRKSSARGPDPPAVRWVHDLGYLQLWGIAVGGDGTVHAAAKTGTYAIDASGQTVWFQRSTPQARTTPALAQGGRTYTHLFSADFGAFSTIDLASGGLSARDRCGNLVWEFPARAANIRSPTLSHEGTIYFAVRKGDTEGALLALDENGQELWSYPEPPGDTFTSSPVLDQEGNIYVGTGKGRVVGLTPAGKLRWSSPPSEHIFQLAVSEGGDVYAASLRSARAFNSEGDLLWMVPVRGTLHPGLALDGVDRIYLATGTGLVALSAGGTQDWEFPQRGTPVLPVVDAEGTVYVAFNRDEVGYTYALDSDGNQKWLFYTETVESMAMGADGTLYVGTDKRLYALGQCADESCPDDGSTVPAVNLDAPAPPKWASSKPAKPKPTPPHHEAHDGYDIYPGCRPGTTAIVRTEGDDFSWYPKVPEAGPMKRHAQRSEFRGAAAGAPRLASHASGFGIACVESRGAFHVYVYPGQDVLAGARAVGEWLKKNNLRGEIDIVVSGVPRNH